MSGESVPPDPVEVADARFLVEEAPVCLALTDADGNVVFVNRRWREVTGWSLEQMGSDRWPRIIHAGDLPGVRAEWRKCVLQRRRYHRIHRIVRPDGRVLHALADFVPRAPAPDGSPTGFVGTITDVGEQVSLERLQRDHVERLRALSEAALDAVVAVDERGAVVEWSPQAERLFGWTRAEALGRDVGELLVPPEQRAAHAAGLARVAAGGEPVLLGRRVELEALARDGRRVPVELSLVAAWLAERPLHVAWLRDISDRRAAEAERARHLAAERSLRRELQATLSRLVEAQEVERRAVATELHDEIGQILTGLRLALERLPASLAERGVTLELAQRATARVRDLSMNLRPPGLDELGLLPALQWNLRRFGEASGVSVVLRHHGCERRFAPAVELAAFRIVQEALTNVARHAGTREAQVDLWAGDRLLALEVSDRGRGFDPAGAAGASTGLAGMRERAHMVGGDFLLDSAPGRGTLVRAELPLAADPALGT